MAINKTALLELIGSQLRHSFQGQDLSLFLLRLGANFERLLALFENIYGEQENVETHFIDLVIAIAEQFLARPEELKILDRQRESEKDWFMSPNWVATMLYVDRYAGDLQGFKKKISYLEELGVTYVHLMPLLAMPAKQNDGGYAVSDYRRVDPRLGSMQDIREIAEIFRDKDMLLELDLVLNHTADEHEWAQRALAGDEEYQRMYFMYDDRRIPDLYEQTLEEVFPENAPGNFTYIESLNKWVHTSFYSNQWDLNYSNPRVFIEMVKILLNLGNQGVDILRLDAVAFMWKRLGTDCRNLDEAHLLLQMFKVCTRISAPGLVFKAEAIVQPNEIVKYLGGGLVEECEIAYNASFMVYLWDAIATQNKQILENGLKNIPRLPAGTTWINYIRCHDDIGLGYSDQDILKAGFNPFDHRQFIISYYVGEFYGSGAKGERFMHNTRTKDARISGSSSALLGIEAGLEQNNQELVDNGIKKLLLLYSLIMSIGGIPLIYYGDEVATLNDYSYLQDEGKREDNRWLNRPQMDWGKVERRTKAGTIEQRVFDSLKKMIKIRKGLVEFHNANDYQLIENTNPQLFSFLRQKDWHKTLVVANLGPDNQALSNRTLNHAGFGRFVYDAYSNQTVEVSEDGTDLKPFQFLWLKQR